MYLTLSMTTKHSRSFDTPVGSFDFRNCSKGYFPIVVRAEPEDAVNFLIATPEKAFCDLINCTKGLVLRFMKDAAPYLE